MFEQTCRCAGAALAIALDEAVRASKEDGFRHNPFKEKKIKKSMLNVLGDYGEVERVYNIVVEQAEY